MNWDLKGGSYHLMLHMLAGSGIADLVGSHTKDMVEQLFIEDISRRRSGFEQSLHGRW